MKIYVRSAKIIDYDAYDYLMDKYASFVLDGSMSIQDIYEAMESHYLADETTIRKVIKDLKSIPASKKYNDITEEKLRNCIALYVGNGWTIELVNWWTYKDRDKTRVYNDYRGIDRVFNSPKKAIEFLKIQLDQDYKKNNQYVRSDYELSEYGNPISDGIEFVSDSEMIEYGQDSIDNRAFEVHYLDYDDNKCIKVIDAVDEDEAERLVGNQSDCSRILYLEAE